MSWGKQAVVRRSKRGGGRPPYPMRQDRDDHLQSESFETLEERLDYPVAAEYEHSSHQQRGEYESSAERTAIYERFYKQLCGDGTRHTADCVVLSTDSQNRQYPKSIGQSLQERGLAVEMLYLQVESGLTRALQDVRSDGCPFCILVEQTNVTLSSCTVIIFSESLKIHRNMPTEQALDFVLVEFGRLGGLRRGPEPNETAARAAEIADDYLDRVKLERHSVPSATRHLLILLGEGLHLYPEELSSLMEYLQNRQDYLQDCSNAGDRDVTPVINSLPPGLGKPPPLLPASTRPAQREQINLPPGSGSTPPGHHKAVTGSYPKTKPPPLLSMQSLKPPSHRPAAPKSLLPSLVSSEPQGSASSRSPASFHSLDQTWPLFGSEHAHGFKQSSTPASRGLLPHPVSHAPRGPGLLRTPTPQNGPRAPPPQLRSLHMGGSQGLRMPRRLLP